MLHVHAFKIQQGAIYNFDARSDIPDMATPDSPSFLDTICDESFSSTSLVHLPFGILLLLLRPRKLSDGFQMLDSIQRDCLNLKSPDNDARNILKQPEIKMSGRASALRLASADAKCHASVKSMQIRKTGATEAGAASTCMRRPRSRPKRPSLAASQKLASEMREEPGSAGPDVARNGAYQRE